MISRDERHISERSPGGLPPVRMARHEGLLQVPTYAICPLGLLLLQHIHPRHQAPHEFIVLIRQVNPRVGPQRCSTSDKYFMVALSAACENAAAAVLARRDRYNSTEARRARKQSIAL